MDQNTECQKKTEGMFGISQRTVDQSEHEKERLFRRMCEGV